MTTPYEDGPADADICLIGEAPSFMEIREGKPFVGPAGQLLERCLHSAQIPRARCRILNVFEEMVVKPETSAGKIYSKDNVLLWTSTRGLTDAGKAASAASLQRVRECKANVIVPLGGTAMSMVLDSRSVMKWRGSILAGGHQIDGRKVVASIHPSAALKGTYEWRWLIVRDLMRAKEESLTPDIRLPERNLIIDPSFEECIRYLKLCRDAKVVNTDIELLTGQVDCFSLALTPNEAICIPLLDSDFESRFPAEEEAQIWKLYAEIISDSAITLVNQNITFDLAILLQLNKIVPRGKIRDPMIAHSVMNPALSKSLGTICSLYTREPYYKDDGILADAPTIEDFVTRWKYNARDSVVSLEADDVLQKMLDEDDYRRTYEMCADLVPALVQMIVHGIRVNEPALLVARQEAHTVLNGILQRMTEAFGRKIITEVPKTAALKRELAGALNVNSPAQIGAYFYDELKLKPYVNDKGARTVDDKAMARILRRDGVQQARLVQEYRSISKLIATYLEMGYDIDKRLRCSYNIRGTWTGRLSSSKTVFDTGGNFQNLPPEMRTFLVSDDAELKDQANAGS